MGGGFVCDLFGLLQVHRLQRRGSLSKDDASDLHGRMGVEKWLGEGIPGHSLVN